MLRATVHSSKVQLSMTQVYAARTKNLAPTRVQALKQELKKLVAPNLVLSCSRGSDSELRIRSNVHRNLSLSLDACDRSD